MTDGEVRYARDGGVATVIFDRPAARNAMTWRMYEQLGEACAQIRREDGLRAAVFRGAGGKAFIAGTDIAQFQAFRGGDDGIAYEEKMEGILAGVEALPVPTLAVIGGFAFGGGLRIASASDLLIATPASRFGIPIARTLGNCLSIANYARLIAALGASRSPSGCCCWRRTCPPRRRWRPAFSARSWSRGSLTGASASCARVWRSMPPSPCA